MSETTEQHLEHAEHAQHAAHNPLDRKVAVSMAIIAAFLAAAAMISHRGHTETLRLSTESNIHHTKASDQWAFFQATNIRDHEYKALIPLMQVVQARPGTEVQQQKALKDWQAKIEEYEGIKTKSPKNPANDGHRGKSARGSEEAEGHSAPHGEGQHEQATTKAGKLGKIEREARGLEKQAHEFEHASHEVHQNVNWIDYGHLGLELALILASITMLTKQKAFWYTGLGAAALGIGLVLIGVTGLIRLGHL
jgi:hypothetical protein